MIFRRKKEETRALIMAAGYGTRLEPLTLAVPKPMMPIVNKPCMQHNLELLKKYGFHQAVCNIHYFPEQIKNYFYDGERFGVSLSYSYEENLLGTAGGVRRMGREIENIQSAFLVLSSDALTDINLQNLFKCHKDKKALATVALFKKEDPSQFGVVILDEADNRITAFQEKPKRENALSNLVNTGIYVFEPEILDMIPKGQFYDFGRELFPALVSKKEKIFGYKMAGYWSDVGGISTYIEANLNVIDGQVQVGIPGKKIGKSIWIGKNSKVAPSAHFEKGVILGEKTVIEEGVWLSNVIVGDRTVISKDSKIKDSIIWDDTIILSSSQITESIIGSWCYIGKEAKINSSVIANRCRLKSSVLIPAGTKLNPGSDLL